jgi:glutathione S-transferase
MLEITSYRWVPEMAQGYVRDIRARWACEEASLPYKMRLIGRAELAVDHPYRQEQPFGQVPVLHDGAICIFESAAMTLHIAEKSNVLLPADPVARARVKAWVIAAINSIEPFVSNFSEACFNEGQAWAQEKKPIAMAALEKRLGDLERFLKGREYLEGGFSVADLVMACVLRDLDGRDVLAKFPLLSAYQARCLARPGFRKALAAQMQTFAEYVPSKG